MIKQYLDKITNAVKTDVRIVAIKMFHYKNYFRFTGGDVHFRLLEDINRLLQFSRSEAEIGEVSKMMLMILSGEYGSDVTEYVGKTPEYLTK